MVSNDSICLSNETRLTVSEQLSHNPSNHTIKLDSRGHNLYVVMVVFDGFRSTLIRSMEYLEEVMSSGGAPTPASTLFCTHEA